LQYAKLVAEGDDLKLQCRSSSKSRHRGRKQRRQYGRRRELTRVGTSTLSVRSGITGRSVDANRNGATACLRLQSAAAKV
jgi:hypothetical protein